ncbi:tRNA(Ile)-lysidine synthase [Bryobacterales bacterium F-183]|nr:tRNA(Ile)-lysidine synthase [Bryobacterales bacterium F-183]
MDLQHLPEAGARIGVAVSGGADSTALFLLLQEHALQYRLSVVHVNHGLRGADSDADEAFCRNLAERFGVPFYLSRVDHAGCANLEEDAREARLRFFRTVVDRGDADCIATAHTRDDQAETVLFRFLRGAHCTGLAGILPSYDDQWLIRPLLDVSRAELVAYLESRKQTWREDVSNQSLAFRRNRIRHELLPQLERDWNPELVRSLAQMAQLAREDEEFWKSYTDSIAQAIFVRKGNSSVVVASNLLSQPVAVARRLVRWVLERTQAKTRQIEYKHVESVLALARLAEGHGRVILPGADVMRSFEWLRFAPWQPEGDGVDRLAARNVEVPMRVPGEATAPDGSMVRLTVVSSGEEAGGCGNDTVKASDGLLYVEEAEEGRIVLRSWKPGDGYRPLGSAEPLKVKTLFQDYRIPLWDRGTWPIITIGNQIVWAREFGPAHERASAGRRDTAKTGSLLRIERIV